MGHTKLHESITGTDYDFNFWSDGHELSDEQARKLIDSLERDPNDAFSILKLLGYYSVRQTADDVERWMSAATWFIRNRPGDWMSGNCVRHQCCTPDQAAVLHELWLEILHRNSNNAAINGRGAQYFKYRDSEKAIAYFNKAIKLERHADWYTGLTYVYTHLSEQQNFSEERTLALVFANGAEAVKRTKHGPKKGLLIDLCLFALKTNSIKEAKFYARRHLREARKVWLNHEIFRAHVLLGRVQLKLGNIEYAKEHLSIAGGQCFYTDFSLASELLQHGEKQVVIDFLNRWLPNANYPAETLKDWIEQIEQGLCPTFR